MLSFRADGFMGEQPIASVKVEDQISICRAPEAISRGIVAVEYRMHKQRAARLVKADGYIGPQALA